MAELVDAHDSKSCSGNGVGVRFSPEAPIKRSCHKDSFFYFSSLILTDSHKNAINIENSLTIHQIYKALIMNKYSRLAVFLDKININTYGWRILGLALLSELLFWFRILTSTKADFYYKLILSSLVSIATIASLIKLIYLSKAAWKFLNKTNYLNYLREEKPLELLQLIEESGKTAKLLENLRDHTLEYINELSTILNAINTAPPDRASILLAQGYEKTTKKYLSQESYESLQKLKESKDIFLDPVNLKYYIIANIKQLNAKEKKTSERLTKVNKIKKEAQRDLDALLGKINLKQV